MLNNAQFIYFYQRWSTRAILSSRRYGFGRYSVFVGHFAKGKGTQSVLAMLRTVFIAHCCTMVYRVIALLFYGNNARDAACILPSESCGSPADDPLTRYSLHARATTRTALELAFEMLLGLYFASVVTSLFGEPGVTLPEQRMGMRNKM